MIRLMLTIFLQIPYSFKVEWREMQTCKWSGILIILFGASWNRPLLATLGLVMLGIALFIAHQQRSLEGSIYRETGGGE